MILSRLREQTRPAHERGEEHIDLLGRAWSLLFYRRLLQKFYGFYVLVEPPIFDNLEWKRANLSGDKRRKIRLLIQDLEFFGLSTHAIETLPRCQNVPLTRSFAQALGCAYVLEGATLGGQIITRHLQRELGVAPAQGSAFFTSYGANVGMMWRNFIEVISTYPLDDAQRNELVQSAVDTFDTLDEWLSDIL